MNWMDRATLGNKARNSEQASVANDRQKPGEINPVAGKRDAQASPSNTWCFSKAVHCAYGIDASASCCRGAAFGHVARSPF
jgi:hypothetical protein